MPTSRRYIKTDRLDIEAANTVEASLPEPDGMIFALDAAIDVLRAAGLTEHYVENEAYNAAVNAIAAMTQLDPDEIKIALGEEGTVWPQSIQADVIRMTIEETAKR
jgi:hypothetical protein